MSARVEIIGGEGSICRARAWSGELGAWLHVTYMALNGWRVTAIDFGQGGPVPLMHVTPAKLPGLREELTAALNEYRGISADVDAFNAKRAA